MNLGETLEDPGKNSSQVGRCSLLKYTDKLKHQTDV